MSETHRLRAIVHLNNVGVSLLQRERYHDAKLAFHAAMAALTEQGAEEAAATLPPALQAADHALAQTTHNADLGIKYIPSIDGTLVLCVPQWGSTSSSLEAPASTTPILALLGESLWQADDEQLYSFAGVLIYNLGMVYCQGYSPEVAFKLLDMAYGSILSSWEDAAIGGSCSNKEDELLMNPPRDEEGVVMMMHTILVTLVSLAQELGYNSELQRFSSCLARLSIHEAGLYFDYSQTAFHCAPAA